MLPDRVSNPGPLTYESGALPIALCRPAHLVCKEISDKPTSSLTTYIIGTLYILYIPEVTPFHMVDCSESYTVNLVVFKLN